MNKETLEKLITKYNDAYYNDVSIVSDSVYDELLYNLSKIDPNNPLVKQVDAPLRDGRWNKATHSIPMGSLFKCKNIKDVQKWFSDKQIGKIVLELKYDGLSIDLKFVQGLFAQAITRGSEGIEGEDITANVINMNFPKVLTDKIDISFRGEILIGKFNFKKLNEISEKPYSNPRNAASGIARNTNGLYTELCDIKIYDSSWKFDSEQAKIDHMKEQGIEVYSLYKDFNEVEDYYNFMIESGREDFEYDIDGLVIKLDDVVYGESLGVTDNRPKWQVALKFPDKAYVSTVTDIKWQVGRTGRLTPVVEVEPTMIDNKRITKASVHNIDQIQQLKLIVGSVVELKVSGDVIPQIIQVIDNEGLYETPTKHNGVKLDKVGPNLFLTETVPEMTIKQITFYLKELGVEDISEKTIESLYNKGVVKSIPELYNVAYHSLLTIDGFAKKSAEQFVDKIRETTNCRLEDFIPALGINGLGHDNTSKLLAKFDIDIFDMKADLKEVFTDETALKIETDYNKKKELLTEIRGYITFKEGEDTLKDMSFCITGKLNDRPRDQYVKLIKSKGGTYKSSVSKGLTYLVTNTPKSGSSKNKKAKDYGTKIIDEEQLCDMVGGYDKVEQIW